MKAPKLYVLADSLDHVLELLDKHGEDARILAGGQSLMPTLNMLVAARVLVDINRRTTSKAFRWTATPSLSAHRHATST